MDKASPFQPWASNESARIVKDEGDIGNKTKQIHEDVNPKHPTASFVRDCNVPGPSNASNQSPTSRNHDPAKILSMQHIVFNSLSQESRQRVTHLLEAVEALSPGERLFLYLRLPTGQAVHDPLKQPANPLGSRAELQQTVTWIQTHLEVDPDVSLPKQDVYDEYIAHCMSSNMKPLSTADFGKVMKQVYPTVRPRRLGTRGNSRYCYAGLRKRIKLEVPQLPDLGGSSSIKEMNIPPTNKNDRIVCDWAEEKLGVKFANIEELARHVTSNVTCSPPTESPGATEDTSGRHLLKQLKRKLQTQSTSSHQKKNKTQEVLSPSSPRNANYAAHSSFKQEAHQLQDSSYNYQPTYIPTFDVSPPYPQYTLPPRAHPITFTQPTPTVSAHDFESLRMNRPDPYVFETPYAPRDLSVIADSSHNLPINLSSDASLDLSTERTEWQRRKPPEPPPARLTLPGKKMILETYQTESLANAPRTQTDTRAPSQATEEYQRTEYLPKKMRAAEIMGGKLAAQRQSANVVDTPSASVSSVDESNSRQNVAFLEDPKNVTNRSKSTAAALAREEQKAASSMQAMEALTPKQKLNFTKNSDSITTTKDQSANPQKENISEQLCPLDGINLKTGMICDAKHTEILNRERVISICNIDKHDLDDYLNEGSSQEHEEELLQYFHPQGTNAGGTTESAATGHTVAFLGTNLDPQDDQNQAKSEKLSQLRELLAKNLKNPSGSGSKISREKKTDIDSVDSSKKESLASLTKGAFKIVLGANSGSPNKQVISVKTIVDKNDMESITGNLPLNPNPQPQISNGNNHNIPQSPTTRTQQYDFVPISEECLSPNNPHSKSPIFGHQFSPSKLNKTFKIGGSLQTSPISHSTAASPFVSPRNTPVPRSRLCSGPISKHYSRKRQNMQQLGMPDLSSKQFVIPNDQKGHPKAFLCSLGTKYCQPMSAPPSPNIVITNYKNQFVHGIPNTLNGNNSTSFNYAPNTRCRDNVNGEITQPLSADPLSKEVSQFFQETQICQRLQDNSYRSQSVPLKQGLSNLNLLSYNNTPIGSVPPTPIPNEFCDFDSLGDTCDISKAGLNPETLDKIYDAIDSSNDVLNPNSQHLLGKNGSLPDGCGGLSEQTILIEEQLNSFIPNDSELLDRDSQFNQSFADETSANDDVDDFIKRTNIIELDLSELVNEKNKFCSSRSVPNTPLPFKHCSLNLNADRRRTRDIFTLDTYSNNCNGFSSKSVPSTPQQIEDRTMFNYSNRDFLINGNSVETSCSTQSSGLANSNCLSSPLHDILREDILAPLTPAADLLAAFDKIDGPPPYADL